MMGGVDLPGDRIPGLHAHRFDCLANIQR